MAKNLPAIWETQVPSLGQEDPLEKEMATHSSVVTWEIPGKQRRLAGYDPCSHEEVDTTKLLSTHQFSSVAQSCPTLCDPMDCSLPRSSIHGIFQTRILEWVAISFSRGSSGPKDWTRVFCMAGRFFTIEPPWRA